MEYDPLSSIYLHDLHHLRRNLRIFSNKNKPEIQKIFKLYFHFSVHHAAVDTRRCMAERVQQQRGCRNVKRTSCISCGDLYAEMVVSGAVPEFRCLRTPLCAVRLYPDRRYFPEYGCEP